MIPPRLSPVGVSPLALVMEDPHLYEDINEALGKLPVVPKGSPEEVLTSPCPAYTSSQLDSVVYEVIH